VREQIGGDSARFFTIFKRHQENWMQRCAVFGDIDFLQVPVDRFFDKNIAGERRLISPVRIFEP